MPIGLIAVYARHNLSLHTGKILSGNTGCDFLIFFVLINEKGGATNLSESLPRSVKEIEALMSQDTSILK